MTTRIDSMRMGGLDADYLADVRLERLAAWGRKFDQLGVSPGASGNLSVRSPRGFFISRTEVELPRIGPEDWVEVTDMSRQDDGSLAVAYFGEHIPSRDAFVHGTVYSREPEARAVFHLHDLAMLDAAEGLGVPSTKHYFPAGTTESVQEIERFLDAHPDVHYFVLVDHGIVAWSTDVDAVGNLVEKWHRRAEEEHA